METGDWSQAVAEAAAALDKAGKVCSDIQEPLTTAYNALDKTDDVLSTLLALEKGIKELDSALSTLGKVCSGLSCVPVVGEFAGQIPRIISPAKQALDAMETGMKYVRDGADGAEKTVRDIRDDLEKFQQSVWFAANHFPQYGEALGMLANILTVFETLAESCQDQGVKDSLAQVSGSVTAEVKGTAGLLDDISTDMETLDSSIRTVGDDVSGCFGKLSKSISGVSGVISAINAKVGGVADVFRKVLNAIKPLKWVLDAASCLFKKLLKPVIDAILKATGIQKLLNALEAAIVKALGLKAVEEDLDLAKRKADEIKDQCTAQITQIQKGFSDTYRELDDITSSAGSVKLIREFLSALLEALKDRPLPPFDGAAMTWRHAQPEPYIPLLCRETARPLSDRPQTGVLHTVPYPEDWAEFAAGAPANDSLNAHMERSRQAMDQFVGDVNRLLATLDGVRDSCRSVEKGAAVLDLYLSILETIEETAGMLRESGYLSALDSALDSVCQMADEQKATTEKLSGDLKNTENQVDALRQLCARIKTPIQDEITGMYENIYGTVTSLKQTQDAIAMGREAVSAGAIPPGHVTDAEQRLDGHEERVNQAADGAVNKLEKFDAQLERYASFLLEEQGFRGKVKDLTDKMEALKQTAEKIGNAALFQTSSVLQQQLTRIHTVLNPLKNILAYIKEQEEKDIQEFNACISSLIRSIEDILPEKRMRELIDEMVSQLSPADRLLSASAAVRESAADAERFLKTQDSEQLYKSVREASDLLQGDLTYRVKVPGREETVTNNLYVEDSFAEDALQIYYDMPMDRKDLDETIGYIRQCAESSVQSMDPGVHGSVFYTWHHGVSLTGQLLMSVQWYAGPDGWETVMPYVEYLNRMNDHMLELYDSRREDAPALYGAPVPPSGGEAPVDPDTQQIVCAAVSLYRDVYQKLAERMMERDPGISENISQEMIDTMAQWHGQLDQLMPTARR